MDAKPPVIDRSAAALSLPGYTDKRVPRIRQKIRSAGTGVKPNIDDPAKESPQVIEIRTDRPVRAVAKRRVALSFNDPPQSGQKNDV